MNYETVYMEAYHRLFHIRRLPTARPCEQFRHFGNVFGFRFVSLREAREKSLKIGKFLERKLGNFERENWGILSEKKCGDFEKKVGNFERENWGILREKIGEF
jgi:hypothetical protein